MAELTRNASATYIQNGKGTTDLGKLIAFIKLDFLTVKPYLTPRNLLLFAIAFGVMTVLSNSLSTVVVIGLLLGTVFLSYPFVIGEKSNMDALYVTLALNRKTVVLGRYLFTALIDLLAVTLIGLLTILLMLLSTALGRSPSGDDYSIVVLIASVLFLSLQAIQLPIYFRFGYTKAKILNIMPYAVVGAAVGAYTSIVGYGAMQPDGLDNLLVGSFGSAAVPMFLLSALLLACFVSYRLALASYRKRDF